MKKNKLLTLIIFVGVFFLTVNSFAGVNEEWVQTIGTSLSDDRVADMVADSAGNVYLTGTTHKEGENSNYITAKLNSNGRVVWSIASGSGDHDAAFAIALGENGGVYVTGESLVNGTKDYSTIKYDDDRFGGVRKVWEARYNGPGNGNDSAYDIVVDEGIIYVTGESVGDGTNKDYATLAYDAQTGAQLGEVRYNGSANGNDSAVALAIDEANNLYVTGQTVEEHAIDSHSYDYTTVQYAPLLDQKWAVSYNGPVNGTDSPLALTVDNKGQVYVTGSSMGSGSNVQDYATVAYNTATGALAWVSRYNGPGIENYVDIARAIDVDPKGDHVYVTGVSDKGRTVTIGYNSMNGDELWVNDVSSGIEGNINDGGQDLVVDPQGNVYVTGTRFIEEVSDEYFGEIFFTIKYNRDGEEIWYKFYDSNEISSSDYGKAIDLDNQGNVYVSGNSILDVSLGSDITILKYSQAITDRTEVPVVGFNIGPHIVR